MNFAYYFHDEKDCSSFEQKLLWFKSRYNLISANELREHIYGGKPLKNSCMLSVDDGWRSTYEVIYPVMKQHNVPFSIFVSPYVCRTGFNFWYYVYRFFNEDELKEMLISEGYFSTDVKSFSAEFILKEMNIDDVYNLLNEYKKRHPKLIIPRGFINTQELKEMHSSGLVEIGTHTMIHPILKNEKYERSKTEITESVTELSEMLDKPITTMAYPNGIEGIDYDEREMCIAKEVGIDMAFSVDPGLITSSTNPLSIPRWGSMARLKFGRLGQYLPSRMNQPKIRKQILEYKL